MRWGIVVLLLSSCGESGGGPSSCAGCDGGGIPDGGAPLSTGEPAVCQRYIDCSTRIAPASAASVLEAYGPGGACWSSTAQVAATCVTACSSGLAQLHPSHPDDPACALCASDGECSGTTPACGPAGSCVACTADRHCGGATPVCDSSTNSCVACTSDAQCGGRGCNLAAHQCWACGTDADCSGTTPACVNHVCAQCSSDTQCGSGKCNADSSCCVPRQTCSFLGLLTYDCGSDDDGCGHTVDCGTCSVGVCSGHSCTNVGAACTVGDSTCLTKSGERCMWVASSKDYRCEGTLEEGHSCGNVMIPDDYCMTTSFSCDYNRTPEVCKQLCLTTAECATGKSCQAQGNPISPSAPGLCQ